MAAMIGDGIVLAENKKNSAKTRALSRGRTQFDWSGVTSTPITARRERSSRVCYADSTGIS